MQIPLSNSRLALTRTPLVFSKNPISERAQTLNIMTSNYLTEAALN